jgi:hypothetical protein
MPSFLLLSLLSIVLLVRACHRGGRAGRLSPVHDLQWALGVTVSLVTAIHLNPHDLTLILFPAWIVASCALVATPRRRGATSWLWVLWLGYAAGILPAFPFVLLNVTLMGAALVLLAREIDGFAPGALASRAGHSPAVQAGSGRR